jgi:hypothetical protein
MKRKTLINRCFEDAVRTGQIDLQGKDVNEVGDSFESFYDSLRSDTTTEFVLVVDHLERLEEEARLMAEGGKLDLASLLYATWFEHWTNSLLRAVAERERVPEPDIISMLREASLRAKTSWLLRIFGLPRLNPDHRNIALKLSDLRNGFVHYKWKSRSDPDTQEERELQTAIASMPAVIRYLKRYERRIIFGDKKRLIREAAVKRSVEIESRVARTPN